MGIELGPGEVAYRCNLVTVDDATGTMVDFSAGHIASELSGPIIEAVDAYATVGEISDRLRTAFGVHRELITI